MSQYLGDTLDTIDRITLLVTGQQDTNLAGVLGGYAYQFFCGCDHRRYAALHVRNTAAKQNTVPELRTERWCRPIFQWTRRYHVGMPQEPQGRLLA